MNISVEWLIGIVFLLVFGSYGWTTVVASWLSAKIDTMYNSFNNQLNEIRDNHIAHLDERVKKLEERD